MKPEVATATQSDAPSQNFVEKELKRCRFTRIASLAALRMLNNRFKINDGHRAHGGVVAVGAHYGLTTLNDAPTGAGRLAVFILSPPAQAVRHGVAPGRTS